MVGSVSRYGAAWGVKLRESGRAQALGGRRFLNANYNQLKGGFSDGGDIGDGMRPWRNESGGRFGIVWGGKLVDEKVETLNQSL